MDYRAVSARIMLATALAAGCNASPVTPDEISSTRSALLSPSDFGYQSMRAADGSLARGARNLLVILLSVDGMPAYEKPDSYYDGLAFGGQGGPNLIDYYSKISNGIFTWKRTSVVAVRTSVVSTDLPTQRIQGVQGAAAAGFDFSQYDRVENGGNGDGQVTESELTIVVVRNGGNDFGQTGGICTAVPGTQVCSKVALVWYKTSFQTFAHELLHTLGAVDVYSSGCPNIGLSLMSCTIIGDYSAALVHPDPWHKIQLGWLTPRVVDASNGAGPSMVVAAQDPHVASLGPLLVYDPAHGNNEYYLFEYRNPALGGYDDNVTSSGLVPWYVNLPNGVASDIKIPDGTNLTMKATLATGAVSGGSVNMYNAIQPQLPMHAARSFRFADRSLMPVHLAATFYDAHAAWMGVHISNAPPTGQTLFADLNADRRADGLAINANDRWAVLSSGPSFAAPTQWSTTPVWGTRGTFLADVDGDGTADLVAVNDGDVWVSLIAAGPPTRWLSADATGTRATFVADFDGDGRADILALDETQIRVSRSTGQGFAPPAVWTSPVIYGQRDTFVADVDGDGRADVIALGDGGVYVARSTGSSFGPSLQWTNDTRGGTQGTFFVDVDGDRRADFVAVDDAGTRVSLSTGASFLGGLTWQSVPFYGTHTTAFADVDGDGRADGIAVNDGDTWVMRSNGFGFDPPTRWLATPFYGSF